MRGLRASVILKVYYLFVTIMLGASGANDETKFDYFPAEFGQMLGLAESILGPSTSNGGSKPETSLFIRQEAHSTVEHERYAVPRPSVAEKST